MQSTIVLYNFIIIHIKNRYFNAEKRSNKFFMEYITKNITTDFDNGFYYLDI